MVKENTINKDRFSIAEVLWEDAWVDPKDYPLKEVMALKPVLRSTVGYAVGSTDECLILATDLYDKDEKTVNTPMVIPWSAIIAWWEFEVH